MSYSVVIPTLGKRASLRTTLHALSKQEMLPDRVVLVFPHGDSLPLRGDEASAFPFPLLQIASPRASAAIQRNLGAAEVTSPFILFLDDDIELSSQAMRRLLETMDRPNAVAVAAMVDSLPPPPSKFARLYYRLQHRGFTLTSHQTPPDRAFKSWGGKLIGPAINLFPFQHEAPPDGVMPSEWLNSACLLVRRSVFPNFPEFEGYSAYEDVYCSAMMAQSGTLYFHLELGVWHHDEPQSRSLEEECARIESRFRHQQITARDIGGLTQPELFVRMLFHRIFVSLFYLKSRPPGWIRRLVSVWTF